MGDQQRRGAEQQENGEAEGHWIVEPLQTAEEVVPFLGQGELVCGALSPWPRHQRPPMKPQDLHAAEGPAESLFLETLEIERHESSAEGLVDVVALISGSKNAQ